MKTAALVTGAELGAYGFPDGHPFGTDRNRAFTSEIERSPCYAQLELIAPRQALRREIERFHTPKYVDFVEEMSALGSGLLDGGDTPAFPGVYESAAMVVGGTLNALDAILSGPQTRAFIPIAGLHHARPDAAAGFCVFNDCGVAIQQARQVHGIERIAYVDIDAHHGDGVFYAFIDDPEVIIADIHEDGRYLYPGTGAREETGKGQAVGTKLNLPLPPGAGDDAFHEAWIEVERFLTQFEPELILLQCGADSVAGDPITHLQFSVEAHAHAARRLRVLADQWSGGRVLGMGGGGYDRNNLARAWTRVVEELS